MGECTFTYTELKALLAEALGVLEVAPSTLSRWMKMLKIKTRANSRRVFYDMEELVGLYYIGKSFKLGYRGKEAIYFTVEKIEEFKQCQSIPTNLSVQMDLQKVSANM